MRRNVLCLALLLLLVAPAAAADERPAQVDVLLTLRERPGLDAFVRAVSSPGSPRYRRYSSVERLVRRFGAPRRARRAVAGWLRARGLRASVGPTGTYVIASGSAAAVRRALAAPSLRSATARSLSVPPALRPRVSAAELLPGPEPRAAQGPVLPPADTARIFGSGLQRSGTAAGCAAGRNANSPVRLETADGTIELAFLGLTPNQYTTAYGHRRLHRRGLRGQGVRVAVLETDGFKRSDVVAFARCFGLRVPRISARPVGTRRMPAPGDETTLDLQVLMAGAPRLAAIDVYATAADPGALLEGAAAAIRSPRRRPDVISISLGICEPGLVGSVEAMRAMDDVFAVAAGAGISVLAATGDDGVTGCAGSAPAVIPAVSAPAALPHVTAVGGTSILLDARNRIRRERVWNNVPAQLAGGGGGISIVFDRPWYQRPLGATTSGPRGITRVVPDIAAMADSYPGYAVYCTAPGATSGCVSRSLPSGGWQGIGGTSAATPLMAAAIALMDQQARRRGQAPLGFVNPLLYELGAGRAPGAVLRDVVLGGNDTGRAVPAAAGGGQNIGAYRARKGFDPASGWGSLQVDAFARAALRAGRQR